MSKVLVTGGSGFIGSHCILQLLAAGHQVRTTVRSLNREEEVRAMLKRGGAEPGERLSFVAADLENDAGWPEAVAGCEFVLHVASPFPPNVPKHENELIVPAREGSLRVLRAAREAGVKRVVLTSSFAAIGYGKEQQSTPLNETNWTDPTADVSAYVKSKTLAGTCCTGRISSPETEGGKVRVECYQSCRRVRSGTRSRLRDLGSHGSAPHGRRDSRLSQALFRRRRCSRRGRFAFARDDKPRSQRRAISRRCRRFHGHARHRQGA